MSHQGQLLLITHNASAACENKRWQNSIHMAARRRWLPREPWTGPRRRAARSRVLALALEHLISGRPAGAGAGVFPQPRCLTPTVKHCFKDLIAARRRGTKFACQGSVEEDGVRE